MSELNEEEEEVVKKVLDNAPPVLTVEEQQIKDLEAQIALQEQQIKDLEAQKNKVLVQDEIQEIQNQLVVFNAGFIAIPLEPTPVELGYGKFGPNFLIVADIYNIHKATFKAADGTDVELKSINSNAKLVYREVILQESNLSSGMPSINLMYASSSIKEIVIEDLGNKSIPLKYLVLLSEHSNMVGNKVLVDTLLDTFSFKGTLNSYKMKYNQIESQKYVDLSLQLDALK